MPIITITADMMDTKELTIAAAFLSTVARAAAAGDVTAEHLGVPESGPKTPRARTKPADKDLPNEDFVVYKADGTKRAGYANAKDAADVVIFAAQELLTHAELLEFGKHNGSTIAKLDKENQARVTAAISKHVAEVKEKEATAKAAADIPTAPESAGTTAPPSSAAPADDSLAALFGGAVEAKPVDAPTMSRQDFIDAMVEIAKGLGPQACKAWATEVQLGNPADVVPERFNDLVEKGRAHLAMLKQGA